MNNSFTPPSRAERLIAFSRLVLALSSLAAVFLDPLEPVGHVRLTYILLGAYAVYASIAAIWTLKEKSGRRRLQLISHVFDLLFFGAINYLTAGSSSPFFVFFIFSIICGTLRFGRRGTAITAAAAAAIFFLSSFRPADPTAFELNRFVIRGTYLFVVASLLFLFADYQQRTQRDLARIAGWPPSIWRSRDELIAQLMRESISIFEARRAVLAFEHLGEREAYLLSEEGVISPPHPEDVTDELFSGGTSQISEAEVMRRYDARSVLSTPLEGDFVTGRLFLLDVERDLLEDVTLARITAGVVASRLDHYFAAHQLQSAAIAEERVRVARDLHDSILQSLTGVAFQLRTLPRLMGRDPDAAQQRFQEIEGVIAHTQKELRWFIEQLNPGNRKTVADTSTLSQRLSSLAQRFRQQWGIEVDHHVDHVIHLLSNELRNEIYALMSEGIANAAKHAAASWVNVAVGVEAGDIAITIADDGKGFPFHGRYDLEQLTSDKRGPVTLRDRVASLGGQMIIDSSELGARIEILIPFRPEEP